MYYCFAVSLFYVVRLHCSRPPSLLLCPAPSTVPLLQQRSSISHITIYAHYLQARRKRANFASRIPSSSQSFTIIRALESSWGGGLAVDDQWGVPGCGVGGDTTTTRRSPFLHFTVVEGRRCKSDAVEGVRSGGRTKRRGRMTKKTISTIRR